MMRRKGTILVVASAGVLLMLSAGAQAGLYVHDSLDTIGGADVAGQTGGFGWSGAYTRNSPDNHYRGFGGRLSFTAGNISDGLREASRSPSGGEADVGRVIANTSPLTGDNSSVWMGFLFGYNSLGGTSAGGFASAAYGSRSLPTGEYGFGISASGGTVKASVLSDAALGYGARSTNSVSVTGSARYMVMRMDWGTANTGDASNHSLHLWAVTTGQLNTVGFDLEGQNSTVSLTNINFDQSQLDTFTFFGDKQQAFDEFRFAPTFLDLVGVAEEHVDIPEPATMALLAMGGLAVLLRRRRK